MSIHTETLKLKVKLRNFWLRMREPEKILVITGDLHLNPRTGDFTNHNIGDDLNLPLLEALTGCHVVPARYHFRSLYQEEMLAIGSIINPLAKTTSIIWGSGLKESGKLLAAPKKICAVRGPLTRSEILKCGLQCPEIYGDPALLMPYVYKPKTLKKKHPVALIPHVNDQNCDFVKNWQADRRHCLDVRNYGKWQNFIDDLCQCETVISSSLHGIILAEAYGIPARRIILTDNESASDFKYSDYYLSYRQQPPEPIFADELRPENYYAETARKCYENIPKVLTEKLLDAFPYPEKLVVKKL